MQPFIEINVDCLIENYQRLASRSEPSTIGAVVKSNAYGLGMIPVARCLAKQGCSLFFTAYFDEASELQEALPDARVAPLHGFEISAYEEAVARNIIPVLNNLPAIEGWAAFARRKERKLPAMIHLDTGMNRLGLSSEEQARLLLSLDLLDRIDIKGWLSHLACGDDFQNPMTKEQKERFDTLLQKLPPAPASLANSSGIFWGKDYLYDMVRPGIALYGGNPTPHLPNPMLDVVTLKAIILQTHTADAGTTVGYCASHKVARKSRIATIAAGYADGIHRTLENKGFVTIEGYKAPVIGRISMDLITLDITDIPEALAHAGALATIIGAERPIDIVAAEAGTISYEILTSLGPRVKRVYTTNASR